MAAIDPERLAEVWRTATSLHTYAVEKATQKWREALTGSPWPQVPEVHSVDAFLKSPEFQEGYFLAQGETIKELAAGRIVGFGQPSDSKEIVRISRSFWAQAQVDDWLRGRVSCNGARFSDVRIKRTRPASRQQLHEGRVAPEPGNRPAPLARRRRIQKLPRKKRVRKSISGISTLVQTPHKKGGGRPNAKDEITQKTREFWNTSQEFRTLHLKEKVLVIRGAILGEVEREEEQRGYKTVSMKKTIGRALSAIRQEAKGNKSTKPV